MSAQNQNPDKVTKISIQDIGAHQVESVSITQANDIIKPIDSEPNATKIPLDNIIKK